jgi:hypothetical protein
MLIIREEQIQAFEVSALDLFEEEMVTHSQKFSPELCEILGNDQLRVAVQQAMTRADQYGFTYRGPIRLYVELMFLFGSSFDTDPQYPFLCKILNSKGDQMERAEQLHERAVDYLQKVSGTDDINTQKALTAFGTYARTPVKFSADDIVSGILYEITRAFPQKAAYVGREALITLIKKSQNTALTADFDSVKGQFLLVLLMYAFGHGCTMDPLYPWISQTLNDEKIINSTARAERLERKAVTWLNHVLAGYNQGANP